MTKAYDVIVVGGGIVGCACVFYLSEHFKRVLLIEKGPIGGGSTAAGMGHVVAMDDSPAQFRLTKSSHDLWNAEPSLRKGLAGGLLVSSDSVIYPMTAASWMLNRAIKRGATLLQGKAVASMGSEQVTLEDGTHLKGKYLVNATGDRAALLTHDLPIEPRKGHLLITDRYPGMVRHQLIELGYLKSAHEMSSESVAFNAQPRATGQVLLGSSRQFVGWDPEIDRKLISKMVKRAEDYLPQIGKLSIIRTWVGFRATTPDKLPIIGPTEGDPSVLVAAGHEGLGITTSVGTGRLIADIVAGLDSAIDRTPYGLSNREAH